MIRVKEEVGEGVRHEGIRFPLILDISYAK